MREREAGEDHRVERVEARIACNVKRKNLLETKVVSVFTVCDCVASVKWKVESIWI